MNNKTFEEKIKPVLTYVGAIGAVLTSVAYIILIIVLIRGFQYKQTTQALVFALINAGVGLIVANFLKYQGISFAKNLPDNQQTVKDYYSLKTKDKKNHGLTFFWITTVIKDVLMKGVTVVATTFGLIYIVIIGSDDWSLMFLAIVNLILFICFGLLALNGAYDYYNNTYVNYMKEKIADVTNLKKKETTDDRL